MTKRSVIYGINNNINFKVYIGSAEDWNSRMNWHLAALRRNDHFNKHLQSAWNKYGESNFSFDVVEDVPRLSNESDSEFKIRLVDGREQHYIDVYESSNSKKGYNIRKKASSSLGIKRSNETKLKMSECKLGNKNPRFGISPTKETLKKLSECRLGDKHWSHGKKFGNHPSSKPILQYSREGNFMKRWSSSSEIQEELNIAATHVSKCCRGIINTYKGYIWKYEDPSDRRFFNKKDI
jgi:group I intron endonuclease